MLEKRVLQHGVHVRFATTQTSVLLLALQRKQCPRQLSSGKRALRPAAWRAAKRRRCLRLRPPCRRRPAFGGGRANKSAAELGYGAGAALSAASVLRRTWPLPCVAQQHKPMFPAAGGTCPHHAAGTASGLYSSAFFNHPAFYLSHCP